MLISYTLRNLFARSRVVLPTIMALTGTVGAVVVMWAMIEGLTEAVARSGSDSVAVIVPQNGLGEAIAPVPTALVPQVRAATGVAMSGDHALVSPEFVSTLSFRRPDDVLDAVPLRGVDQVAFEIHPGIQLVEGRFPNPGEPGLVVGIQRAGRYKNLVLGGEQHIGKHTWKVVGIMKANGARFESEVWADRAALMTDKRVTDPTVIYVKLKDAASFDGFSASLSNVKGIQVARENELQLKMLKSMTIFLGALRALMAILILGAVFACANVMHAAFLARIREFSTLRAIGFTPGAVVWLLFQESILVTGFSGVLGVAASFLVHGHSFVYVELGIVYQANVTPMAAGAGLAVAALIGVLGSLPALLQSLKLDVLVTLRTG